MKEPANLRTLGGAFGPDARYIWLRATGTGSLYNAE